jgi:SNF2 family DNA or RNA helicase
MKIGEILFSEGTYEIEVKDKQQKKPLWPFLQIDDDGKILDAFCTCKESEKEKMCSHIRFAYLKIFRDKKPLHLRFKESFWYRLFDVMGSKFSYDTNKIQKKGSGKYTSDKILFIQAKGDREKKRLKEIIEKKVKETEETSIKFSRLSLEELAAYRKGEASKKLLFELSPFSDLAKECMFLQENNQKYKVEFFYEKDFPSEILISFERIVLRCFIDKRDLEEIIPTLNSIKSPLVLFDYEESIEKVLFDSQNVCFKTILKKEKIDEIESLKSLGVKSIGKWIYVPKKGFILREKPFFLEIEKKGISDILLKHKNFLKKYLKEKISYKPKKVNYFLFFDKNNNLHIRPFVFEKGDLLKGGSFCFKPFVYIEGKGFYLLEGALFCEKEKIVLEEKVADFVYNNRAFLQGIKEFCLHYGSFQEEIVYEFIGDDLRFDSQLVIPKGIGKVLDFGSWIYVRKKGFYSKVVRNLPIRPKMVVKGENIDKFILSNKKDLEGVVNFFLKENPVKKIGVNIEVNESGFVEVTPKIIKKFPGKLKIFENFVYVENRGFFELPFNFKLPEEYRNKRVIKTSKIDFFINYELDSLKNFIIHLDKKLKRPKNLKLGLLRILREENFWVVGCEYSSKFGKVRAVDVWKNILNGKKYFFSNAGLIDLKEKRFEWLKVLGEKRVEMQKNLLKLNSVEWLKVSIYENVKKVKGEGEEVLKANALLEELNSFKTKKPLNISKLKLVLRPYQERGVQWLWFLYCNSLSGLLCDEMGLGKTIQAMALLAGCFEERKGKKYLIVCPTSVIYHWDELIKKYLKGFRVLCFHGISRKLDENFDILLTSYGLLRADAEKFSSFKFDVAIFDEIQIAKNKNSKTHKTLKKISSNMFLGLSGTPIENRLKELQALFDIVLPNYLPNEFTFKTFFINPIEKERDKNVKKLLSKLVKPFILRRLKKEVLTDLPEKVEEIIYCDLKEDQKKFYSNAAKVSKDEIIKELENRKKPLNYLHVFALLSKLKRVCDHPAIVEGDIVNYQKYGSGKWELFEELLNEILESKQKVVVFTQYLGMLDIFEKYLKKRNIGYGLIKGSTVKRQEEIKKFRENPKCTVFLASLLAGGLGIDLSCASVVIHYDRWWNPAKEDQATDRVHRIGQSRGVQVFKLVTKNTIEERIHEIIDGKKHLMEEIIAKDDSEGIKTLSREELLKVLKEIGE